MVRPSASSITRSRSSPRVAAVSISDRPSAMLHFGCAPFEELAEPRLRGGITLREAGHQGLKQITRRRRTFGDARQRLDQRDIGERRVVGYPPREFDALLQSFAVRHDILR